MALDWWRVGSFGTDDVYLWLQVDTTAQRIAAVRYRNRTHDKAELVITRGASALPYRLRLDAGVDPETTLEIPPELRPSMQAIEVGLRWPAASADLGPGPLRPKA